MSQTENAAIYCRISYDRTGEGLGVERQEQECRALAERLGLTVDAVYVDNDISATSGVARPAFDELLASKPAAIVAWHQDRLLRLTRDLERVISLNVPVYTVTAGTLELSTPSGRAVARTVAAWSQYEGEQKAVRQKSANDQRAMAGMPAGQVGYGFARVNGAVVAVPEQVAAIREAVRRVLAGDSLRAVCLDFQTRGIPTPGKGAAWNTTTLRQLLLRESLAGLRRHRGAVVGEMHPDVPRIITVDTHDRLKALLNDPKRRVSPIGRAPKYLLGGIARCGRCGGAMARLVGRMATTKSGGTKRQPPAYACSECHRVRRKQEFVDAVVEGVLIARLTAPDAAGLFAHGDSGAAADARAALDAVQARLSNAADAFAAGSLEVDQLTRITTQLRAEKERLEGVLQRALPPAVPADIVGPHAAERWHGLSMDAKRNVVRMLMRVTILPSGSGRSFDPESVQIEWLSEAT